MTAPNVRLQLVDGEVRQVRQQLSGENGEIGSEFAYNDQAAFGWSVTDPSELFDYSQWEARDLDGMLRRDYRSRQLEAVLCYPLMAADKEIRPISGDRGEAEFLKAMFDSDDDFTHACTTPLDLVYDQRTSAFCYKKAFHELVFAPGTGPFEGKTILRKVGWRPQTTCRVTRKPGNGEITGFEQELYFALDPTATMMPRKIPTPYGSVYVHGSRRDPINGVSDMEIAYWAYKLKQRVIFLILQYLENVSLPRTVVKGQDENEVKLAARNVARTKGSGAVPIWSNAGPQGITAEQLDVSGKGSEQFLAMIKWLDGCAVNAVLAGFLDLASQATQGAGSLALSKDASDFYLQSLEAKQVELRRDIRRNVFAPVIAWNFGPDGKVPDLHQEPLVAEDKSTAVQLLQSVMAGRDPALIPQEFIGMLAEQVSDYLGMDGNKVHQEFQKAAADAEAKAQQMMKLQSQQAAAAASGVARAGGAVNKAGQMLAKAGAVPKPPKPTPGITTPAQPTQYAGPVG